MKKRNLIVVLVLIIGIAAATCVITFFIETDIIRGMKLSLVHDNKIQQPGSGSKESIDTQTSMDTNTVDPSKTEKPASPSSESTTTQAAAPSEEFKNVDNQSKVYLFDIYSDKDNVEEAVKEISLKYIEEVKDSYNEDYIKEGVDQRMEDARLVNASIDTGYCDGSYNNLVEGGTLTVYDIEFELKPKYPEKFTPTLVIETLQDNGWVYMEGRELLIYHEDDKMNAPYYLAKVMLFDEFLMGKPAEQVLEEIVKNQIPQLKLLKGNNSSN